MILTEILSVAINDIDRDISLAENDIDREGPKLFFFYSHNLFWFFRDTLFLNNNVNENYLSLCTNVCNRNSQ